MDKHFGPVILSIASLLVGCSEPGGDYVPLSSIGDCGLAAIGTQTNESTGREVKVWGFVDHGNIYGDDQVRALLLDWWSGVGPGGTTWRFNLKSREDDGVGCSLAVHVQNDDGRDGLLRVLVADARAGRPTKVFVTGRMLTFPAPTNFRRFTGLRMEVQSSRDIGFRPQGED